MSRQSEDLQRRAAEFARRIIALCEKVPQTLAGRRISGQLIDAASAVSSNYRAACRGRSHAEFTAKIGTVAEEADETIGWLKLLESSGLLRADQIEWELQEANELTAIFAASFKTARENERRRKPRRDQSPRRGQRDENERRRDT